MAVVGYQEYGMTDVYRPSLLTENGVLAQVTTSKARLSPEAFKYHVFHAFNAEYEAILSAVNQGQSIQMGRNVSDMNSTGGMMALNMYLQSLRMAKQVLDGMSDAILDVQKKIMSGMSGM